MFETLRGDCILQLNVKTCSPLCCNLTFWVISVSAQASFKVLPVRDIEKLLLSGELFCHVICKETHCHIVNLAQNLKKTAYD